MTAAGAAVAGAVAALALWAALRPTFASPVLLRRNWRDRDVPTAAGVVLVLAVVAVEAARVVIDGRLGVGDGGVRLAVVITVVGLGLLGTVDDLLGDASSRGFRGHLGALREGRLTTGLVKLAGGAAVAVVACAVVHPSAGRGQLLADGAVVALAANLGNLFDRAPGRVIKISVVAFGALALTAGASELAAVAVVIGAGVGLLVPDVRERLMLGDAGANPLGGALGVGVVAACAPATRVVVLVVLVGLNLAAELVSFSRVIDSVPPLRAADRWGRPPA
jgi:UDP-N-acetylmuramyl pentapeptide phosphotransferase/UDP-N-acetylglucosamine-1-phosphate transferase